jgi:hypothetical protein
MHEALRCREIVRAETGRGLECTQRRLQQTVDTAPTLGERRRRGAERRNPLSDRRRSRQQRIHIVGERAHAHGLRDDHLVRDDRAIGVRLEIERSRLPCRS